MGAALHGSWLRLFHFAAKPNSERNRARADGGTPRHTTFALTHGHTTSNPFLEVRLSACRSVQACFAAATLALVCGSTAAVAADMPLKAADQPPYQWSGCYGGINLGAGASGTNFGSTVGPGTHLLAGDPALVAASGGGAANTLGLVVGGQTGCNWQSGTLVLGLEGDFDYFHSNPSFNNNTNTLSDGVTPFAILQSLTTDFLATIRPRIGIAADRNLAYITGGAAFTRVNYTESYVDGAAPPGAGAATASRYLTGWVAGAGWEYAFSDRWTVRAEYLFASFPKTSAAGALIDAAGGTNPLQGSSDLVIQLVRAGVNFKF
jgi:outer membrane immunogenic protein